MMKKTKMKLPKFVMSRALESFHLCLFRFSFHLPVLFHDTTLVKSFVEILKTYLFSNHYTNILSLFDKMY